MEVKLIQMTRNPIDVMWTAARTCYSEQSPIDIWKGACFNVKKFWELVQKVLSSGHKSIAEHVYFTFAIEGISRACSHQLVRHRHCTFSQQSQRYVEIKEDISLLEGIHYTTEEYASGIEKCHELIEILDKYFVWNHDDYAQFHSLCNALYSYLFQIREGVKPEDARQVLPNATKTNLVMSCNLNELMHICNLRLCTRAQKEIRELFQLIKEEVYKQDERVASLLVPTCEVHGFCTEAKCCGRKPSIKEIK